MSPCCYFSGASAAAPSEGSVGTAAEVGGGCEDAAAGEQEEVGAEYGGRAAAAACALAAAAASAEVAVGCEDASPGCPPGGGEAQHSCPSCQGSSNYAWQD